VDVDPETAEVRCQMTGFVLQQAQPQYLHHSSDLGRLHGEMFDRYKPGVDDIPTGFSDAELLKLFKNNDVDSLLQLFDDLMSGLLNRQQLLILFTVLCNREQLVPNTFNRDISSHYLHALLDLKLVVQRRLPEFSSNYRRYNELRSFLLRTYRVLNPLWKQAGSRKRKAPPGVTASEVQDVKKILVM
jgi:hypothetical protein